MCVFMTLSVLFTDGVKKSLTASKVKLQSRKVTQSAPNVKDAQPTNSLPFAQQTV